MPDGGTLEYDTKIKFRCKKHKSRYRTSYSFSISPILACVYPISDLVNLLRQLNHVKSFQPRFFSFERR